jgi:hypothetical protein
MFLFEILISDGHLAWMNGRRRVKRGLLYMATKSKNLQSGIVSNSLWLPIS